MVVSVWPDQLSCAICQVLRQIMSGKAEGIRHGRIPATADLGSQQANATVRTLRIHPSVIVAVAVNSRDNDGLIARGKANG